MSPTTACGSGPCPRQCPRRCADACTECASPAPIGRPGRCTSNGGVSGRGVTQVAGQRLPVGFAHRHTLVDIDVHEAELHIYGQDSELLAVIPRTSGKEVRRSKGYGVRDRIGSGTFYADGVDLSMSGGGGVVDASLCSARLHNRRSAAATRSGCA
jgi:hypothetical protein